MYKLRFIECNFHICVTKNVVMSNFCKCVWHTGGWWHLYWGGRADGNGWNGIGGMVSNTSNMVCSHSIRADPAIIRSRPPLSSLHWSGRMMACVFIKRVWK